MIIKIDNATIKLGSNNVTINEQVSNIVFYTDENLVFFTDKQNNESMYDVKGMNFRLRDVVNKRISFKHEIESVEI